MLLILCALNNHCIKDVHIGLLLGKYASLLTALKEENKEGCEKSEQYCKDLSILSIVEFETNCQQILLDGPRQTRSKSCAKLCEKERYNSVRKRRIKSKQHLKLCFKQDLLQSICELNYVMKQTSN